MDYKIFANNFFEICIFHVLTHPGDPKPLKMDYPHSQQHAHMQGPNNYAWLVSYAGWPINSQHITATWRTLPTTTQHTLPKRHHVPGYLVEIPANWKWVFLWSPSIWVLQCIGVGPWVSQRQVADSVEDDWREKSCWILSSSWWLPCVLHSSGICCWSWWSAAQWSIC